MGASYKGAIEFGLIYIPVNLTTAVSEQTIGFNLIHKKTGERIRYKKTCESCEGEVRPEEIVKGYNYEGDRYVLFEDSDFEKIKTEKDKNIHIIQFIDISEINTVYFDKAYYVMPSGAFKAFSLLKRAMKETNKAGIAKAVLGTKEKLIALRPDRENMILNTLYFASEVKTAQPVQDVAAEPAELELAKTLIQNMTLPFKPEEYRDEYNEKLRAAIEQKIRGQEITAVSEKPAKVIDLMEALKQSIEKSRRIS